MQQPSQNLKIKDLESEYGRCISDKELAKYLDIDVRTLRKYAHHLGGVMIIPGRYRFFENLLKEVFNAELNNEKWHKTLPWKRTNSMGTNRQTETKTVSRRQQKIVQGLGSMGKRNSDQIEGGNGLKSRHGVF